MDVVMDGIVFGESPRWRDEQLWFSDWGAGRVFSVAADGTPTVEAEVVSFPMCIDFLPDGRLLVVSSASRQLLRREPDGSLLPHADLASVSTKPWNDIVVDAGGNAYVNSIGFDFPEEEFAPGIVVLVTPDGKVSPVADGLAFPNGMAITSDGSTLIVAESYAEQLTAFDIADDGTLSGRRVWATTPGEHPDGSRDGRLTSRARPGPYGQIQDLLTPSYGRGRALRPGWENQGRTRTLVARGVSHLCCGMPDDSNRKGVWRNW